jgi:hypothetical protein
MHHFEVPMTHDSIGLTQLGKSPFADALGLRAGRHLGLHGGVGRLLVIVV